MSTRTGSRPIARPAEASPMSVEPLPLPIQPAPDPVDPDTAALLSEPLASAYAAAAGTQPSRAVRGRLLERLSASRAASQAMVTARLKRLPATEVAPGVAVRTLYAAADGSPQRPGEPLLALLVDLQPGSRWAGPEAGLHREWLVLRGSAQIGAQALSLRDYHVAPASHADGEVSSAGGARLFLRTSALQSADGDTVHTVRDADAGWPDYAPGIRRRVLWQRDGMAALLYHAAPGAAVPVHTHGHDEECLMVQGELFLDDLLLQEGDYQLAPAGTGHRITTTDTGVVIYAHGDLDLAFV